MMSKASVEKTDGRVEGVSGLAFDPHTIRITRPGGFSGTLWSTGDEGSSTWGENAFLLIQQQNRYP